MAVAATGAAATGEAATAAVGLAAVGSAACSVEEAREAEVTAGVAMAVEGEALATAVASGAVPAATAAANPFQRRKRNCTGRCRQSTSTFRLR